VVSIFATGVMAMGAASAEAASYRLSIEPVHPPERAREIYQPLADYLSKATGETIVLVTSRITISTSATCARRTPRISHSTRHTSPITGCVI